MDLQNREYQPMYWYVMRDLGRSNAKIPAYRFLEEKQFEVFTPMRWRLVEERGKRIRKRIPIIPDLLFVYSTRNALDEVVDRMPTLQYRYVRGAYCEPMIVPQTQMEPFLRAVRQSDDPGYYLPGEITSEMCGRTVRIVGGAMDGVEGQLLKVRGSRKRRLVVRISSVLDVAVEISPEYVYL